MKKYPRYEMDDVHDRCHECSLPNNSRFTMVMLPLAKWLKICVHPKEFLCLQCIEWRLGRELTPKDFPNKPMRLSYGSRYKVNVRTIPVNQWFFEQKGWNLKIT